MGKRYELDPDPNGWTVCDRLTGRAVVLDGKPQKGLDFDQADRLLEQLNRPDVPRPSLKRG